MRRTLPLVTALAVTTLAAAFAVACGDDDAPSGRPAPVASAVSADAARASERIEWLACGHGDVKCGYVTVPADYRDPEAGSIRIYINIHRARAPEERIGYLLLNPGGPGGSGVNFGFSAPLMFPELLQRFDIVGFDPRGVGKSEPAFACGEANEQASLLDDIEGAIDTPAEVATGEAAASLCIESMGAVGGLLHSAYVARDMDEIRKVLGAEQISYLGYSYGSELGIWYATLFPRSVRTMVVDGAYNPVDPETREARIERDLERIGRFEGFLERALKACDEPSCLIYNEGDPIAYYHRAVAKLGLVNEAVNDPQGGQFGVVSTLYSEMSWPDLWGGLFELWENDDPAILAEYARFQLDPEPRRGNITAHINCLDDWALHPDQDRETRFAEGAAFTEGVAERFPLLAALGLEDANTCPLYDRFAPDPLRAPFDGGGVPILVIGNRDDPFTQFSDSEELAAEVLANGYLVEVSHASHGVYPDNACVKAHVHRALLENAYPEERRVVCAREDRSRN